MAATTRRYAKRLPREVRREQILDATLRLIAANGFAGMTMEAVAAEAEIAKSVVYAVFGSQEGLQHALMVREQERAFVDAEAAVAAGAAASDPLVGIRDGLLVFLDGVAQSPDTWRLVLLPVAGTPESVGEAIREGRERWRRALEPVAAQLLGRVGLDDLDHELVAHVVRGNAEYLARLMLEDPERFTRERIAAFASQAAEAILAVVGGGAADVDGAAREHE
ncbi:MAG: TetR family transcriptional regulator [Patulibacter sp.]